MVGRKVVKILHEAAWPVNFGTHRTLRIIKAKKYVFGVLRQKSRSRL